jgi:hypothetical protein
LLQYHIKKTWGFTQNKHLLYFFKFLWRASRWSHNANIAKEFITFLEPMLEWPFGSRMLCWRVGHQKVSFSTLSFFNNFRSFSISNLYFLILISTYLLIGFFDLCLFPLKNFFHVDIYKFKHENQAMYCPLDIDVIIKSLK